MINFYLNIYHARQHVTVFSYNFRPTLQGAGILNRFWKFFQHCFVKIGANLLGNAISPKNKNVMLERRFQIIVSSKMAMKSFESPCLFS